jgi:tetratricopeptide (TPR) repeat protein
LDSIDLQRPKNWQDFERQIRALFARELSDSSTQMNGRSGQPQCGVDVYGYREAKIDALVGIQCKLSSQPLTSDELTVEVRKARQFKPALSEFILVSTAPRDAKIQEVARRINSERNPPPFRVTVWGWEDVCECAAKHKDVWKVFDPTWNSFADWAYQETAAKLSEIQGQLSSLGIENRSPSVRDFSVSRQQRLDLSRLSDPLGSHFVGRQSELDWLTSALESPSTRIAVIVGEGGGGKSFAVSEWLRLSQAVDYYGLPMVLGWSFYDQGTKERTASSEEFFNWLLKKLGLVVEESNAITKAEAVASAIARTGGLLVLDGVEVLQHGPGVSFGELKDPGLRALLRSLANVTGAAPQSLAIITTRSAIPDLSRWRDVAVRTLFLPGLSKTEGAKLLSLYGVEGSPGDLERAATEYVGHPLALTLLATYLVELHSGDVRKRDHIRGLLSDDELPGQAHARRVLESIEQQWLAKDPILLQTMLVLSVFGSPAYPEAIFALLKHPPIDGLTISIPKQSNKAWKHNIARLRDARLLLPATASNAEAIDIHPLIREWFDYRCQSVLPSSWRAAHSRLYDHFRKTTHERESPTFEQLAPLYQAVRHGCSADRHLEALQDVYWGRIERRTESGSLMGYAWKKLGAVGAGLTALGWFFDEPFSRINEHVPAHHHPWLLNAVALFLRAQGRFDEALAVQARGLEGDKAIGSMPNAAVAAANMGETLFALGRLDQAEKLAAQSVELTYTKSSRGIYWPDSLIKEYGWIHSSGLAEALYAQGKVAVATELFEKLGNETKKDLGSIQGSRLCEFYIHRGDFDSARLLVKAVLSLTLSRGYLQDIALAWTLMCRILLHDACLSPSEESRKIVGLVPRVIDLAISYFRRDAFIERMPLGNFTRAGFYRLTGNWRLGATDLAEIEEISARGPLQLMQCDLELERARLLFAEAESHAPLAEFAGPISTEGMNLTKVQGGLFERVEQSLLRARSLIEACGYLKRQAELLELEQVLAGARTFASLPTRI